MDLQKIVGMLMSYLGKNPQLIAQFLSHPYSTTQAATGATSQLSSTDMSQVVTALAALYGGQQVDYGNLAGTASQLMGANNNSVHSLASSLFGGQQAQVQAQQAASTGASLDLGSLVTFAGLASQLLGASGQSAQAAAPAAQPAQATTTATGATKPKKRKTSSSSSSTAAASSSSAKPKVDLSDGIDMMEAMTIASQLLGSKK